MLEITAVKSVERADGQGHTTVMTLSDDIMVTSQTTGRTSERTINYSMITDNSLEKVQKRMAAGKMVAGHLARVQCTTYKFQLENGDVVDSQFINVYHIEGTEAPTGPLNKEQTEEILGRPLADYANEMRGVKDVAPAQSITVEVPADGEDGSEM